ncbi:hypothetical protein LSH36_612g00006, partial [Paralvinella palmiformis]
NKSHLYVVVVITTFFHSLCKQCEVRTSYDRNFTATAATYSIS